MTLAAAPMYFYKRGKGRYRKAPAAALAAALASVERKKHEAEQMAAWVDGASRGPAARRDARQAADASLQARQERARVEGARRGERRVAKESGGAPGRVRRHSIDARLPLQRVSGAGLPAGRLVWRVRRAAAAPRACPLPMSAHSRSTMRRPRKSTTRFRCASCRMTTTRSAFTSPRRRSAFRAARRSTRWPGRDCRRSTCRVASSRCCPMRSSTCSRWPKAAARRRCRCTRR